MLGSAWLLIAAALFLAAVILRQVPLLLVSLLFFLASGVARLWAHYALQRVQYSRSLSASGRPRASSAAVSRAAPAGRRPLPP